MSKTRWSLVYLAVYTLIPGVASLFFPEWTLKVLGAQHDYGTIAPRFLGLVSIVLGFFVLQVIRYRITILYPTLLNFRLFIGGGLIWLYFLSEDRLFINVFIVGAIGVIIGLVTSWQDKINLKI